MPIKEGRPRQSLIKYDPEFQIFEQLPKKKKVQLVPLDSKLTVQDILNTLIPPLQWKENGKILCRKVSTVPSSRQDVANLQKLLDDRLASRQARQNGICPIREQLHYQCFDEIIRQVTLDCQQRGILLVRVRDELKMTISAYQTLYHSSVTFGMRKQLQSQLGTPQLQAEIKVLTAKKTSLKQKMLQLGKKKQFIEKQIKDRRAVDEKKRSQEIQFLKYQFNNFQNFLKQANELNK